ncbi:MAG: hypothetical protein C4547_08725 [Phycisphaerales bacterium]|nr:MAG: hypothetical protein C4547_08725 [Phycisphaerales bacterium]
MSEAPAGQSDGAFSDWLHAHRDRVRGERDALLGVERRWSWTRLASFAAAVWVWYPLRDRLAPAAIAALALLVLFAFAVRRHVRARRARQFDDRRLLIIDEARRRCGGVPVVVRASRLIDDDCGSALDLPPIIDDGPTWRLTGQERDDLDLFADPVGLFGLLNRTSTLFGARRLADALTHSLLTAAAIAARQAAVRGLEERPAERIALMAALAELRSLDALLTSFARAVDAAEPLGHRVTIYLIRGWGAASAVAVLVMAVLAAGGAYGAVYAAIGLLLVNMALFGGWRARLERALHHWRNTGPAARALADVSARGRDLLPSYGSLGSLRSAFAEVVRPHRLPTVARRLGWTEAGGMFHALCNVVFFYDLHVAQSILGRIVPHREAFLKALSAMAELELLASLACFAVESRGGGPVCFPAIGDGQGIDIEDGRHPLLEPAEVVPNGIRLDPRLHLWIITGSNMAGKSTFLRMVCTNVVLAQMGSAVTARRMAWSPVRLVTDLRARDDLARHESYFLAEVRQLKRMIVPPGGEPRILGAIDEPFRGTNSAEQVAAGVAVVEHLMELPHFYLLATHERELTRLADGVRGANCHFQENLSAEGMTFDYRLRPGRAESRNALRVLEREAYPQEVIERARQWIAERGA